MNIRNYIKITLRTANPHPYTHQMTPPMTPSVTAPLLDLQTLTPTRIRWQLQWHPVWGPAGSWICKPPPVHASDDSFNDGPVWRQPGLGSANPDPHTHQTTPRTTPCVNSPSPATNPQNLRTLAPQLEVRTPIAKAIWGKTQKVTWLF